MKNHTRNKTSRAVTYVEILIASALFAMIFFPLSTIISNSLKKTHELNYENVAEQIAKSILEQIVNTVPFDRVTENLTVGIGNDMDIKLHPSDQEQNARTTFSGAKTGSIIGFEGAEFKWDLEIYDINVKDFYLSIWEPRNERPPGSPQWPKEQIGTQADGLSKVEPYVNITADNYVKGDKKVILKTIKLKMSWRKKNEKNDNFNDPRKKFVLITRKARLDDDTTIQ